MLGLFPIKGPSLVEEASYSAKHLLSLDDAALLTQCEVDRYRASGPGGQKRNKTSSAVRLRHRPTGLSVTAEEERSQHINKARAVKRLREAIALNLRTALDLKCHQLSETLAECISSGGKLVVGRRDHRYPLAVAELLDVLAACGMRVSEAAEWVGVSTAGLVKFLQRDPKFWAKVNQMRGAAGMTPLR